MRWVLRILGGIFGGVLALAAAVVGLAVAAAVGGWLWLSWNQPPTQGRVALEGIQGPVEVLRDGNGIPHIFAARMDDAYFALGYLHAQDRLFQMEMMRRVGAGRLSEMMGFLGDFTLRLDRMMRTFGFYAHAEASYDTLAPDVRQALDAYAAGVNAWLATRNVPLPLEFQLLWHTPEPWRPSDSLVWGKLMALQLASNYNQETLRAHLIERLGAERADELFPQTPPGLATTLASTLVDWPRLAATLRQPLGPSTASNEWVLSPSRTGTGGALLVNDPHLGLDAPVLWYLARVVTPELELTGATVPGVPMHVLGHNGTIAWGATTTGGDVQDLVVERIDPQDPSRYLAPDGPRPFKVREEVIGRRFAEPLRIQVRETHNGPVLSDLQGTSAPAAGSGEAVSIRFTALDPADTSAEAVFRVNRARDWTQFKDALRLYRAPQQNFVYADRVGNIGFIAPARIPIRREGMGLVPVPGWDARFDWVGFLPFDDLPQAYNPPSGRFVNANNRVVPADYPHLIALDWADHYRAQRIEQLLDEGGPQSVETSETLLMDNRSVAASDLLPVLLGHLGPVEGNLADAAHRLRAWSGDMLRDLPEPLIFEWWLLELNRALFADELGPLMPEFRGLNALAVHRALTERTHWCDDVTTPAIEGCGVPVRRALEATLSALTRRHGADVAKWRWGNEHVAPLAHQVLSRIPILRDLVDLSVETDGGFYTVNRGATRTGDPNRPFANIHGAGYRAIYDLADPANSRFVITTGQSGNPLSRHWGDFVRRWRDGGHVRIHGTREELAAQGAQRLSIAPAR